MAVAIERLEERVKDYLSPDEVQMIMRAYDCARDAHEGQFRRSGDPYIIHPVAVANILADLHMDHQTLMAALLHDVIEDTHVTKEELSAQFGEAVAELVDGVSKLTQIETRSKAEAQALNFQKMTLAMAKDIRVILVKLADRLHNMRTLGPLRHDKRRRIATETLDIYAPIANRLGINSIQIELEDLGFKALYPMRSRYISKAVENLRGDHTEIIAQIKTKLEGALATKGIEARIIGREKHLNSIYRKMKEQHKSFHEIMDVYAFRVIVEQVDQCYLALGAVHSLYKPVPMRFKDYIAMPKANGYQSLHTTLFGLQVNIEIQIRTQDMDDVANYGIAAHWLYKDQSDAAIAHQVRVERWLKGLMEIRERADNSMEFIEHAKIDLFPDEVYVFTPKGAILEMPGGATPVDFAYSIHTDVGNACVACRINKKLAALSEPLRSGQTVEIITAPGAKPSRAWLGFVVTGKAKSSIRHYLKNQEEAESLELGRALLERSVAGFGKSLGEISEAQIEKVLNHNQITDFDTLLKTIGSGKRIPYIIARQLLADEPQPLSEMEQPEEIKGVMIKGTEGMKITFGHCCHPIPGDPIIGIFDTQSGLVVHAEQCHKMLNSSDGKAKMHLSWVKDISDDFVVELRVELERQRGIIAELAMAITRAEANLDRIGVVEQDAKMSVVNILLQVRGRKHLARVMRRIRSIRAVIRLTRVIS